MDVEIDEEAGGMDKEKLSKIEKCLSLNEGYTDLLKSFVDKVDEAIESNQKNQRNIQQLLDEGQGEKKMKGANFVPCEPPYFKDCDGLAPSTSELAKEIKRHLDGADPLMRDATKWKISEIRMLKAGVRESLLETLTRAHEDRKFDAANALKSATIATTKEEVGGWKAALNGAQAEIRRIRAMPDAEIFGGDVDYSSIDWQKISCTKFKGQRSAAQLEAYWMVEMRPDPLRERPRVWSTEEDDILLSLVNPSGPTDWDEVAMAVGRRSAFQCFERFKQTTLGGAGKAMWTAEEDRTLLEAVRNPRYLVDGEINWIKITSDLFSAEKNKLQVQGRYERSLDSRIHRGKWDVEEDVQLLRTINKCGDQDWEKIAAQVAGRTAQQSRNRWVNVLDPRRRSRPFLWSELERLVLGISVFGRHDYSRIAMLLPGRNSGDAKSRIQAIVRYRIDREEALAQGEEARAYRLAPKNLDHTSERRKEAWDKFAEAMEAEREVLPMAIGSGGKPDFFTMSSTDGEAQGGASVSNTRQFGERIPLRSGRWVRVARSPNEYDEAKLVELLSSECSGQLRNQVMLCLHKTEEKFQSELRDEAETAEDKLKDFYDAILANRMDTFNEMLDNVLELEDADYANYTKIKGKHVKDEGAERPTSGKNGTEQDDGDPLGGPEFDEMDT